MTETIVEAGIGGVVGGVGGVVPIFQINPSILGGQGVREMIAVVQGRQAQRGGGNAPIFTYRN